MSPASKAAANKSSTLKMPSPAQDNAQVQKRQPANPSTSRQGASDDSSQELEQLKKMVAQQRAELDKIKKSSVFSAVSLIPRPSKVTNLCKDMQLEKDRLLYSQCRRIIGDRMTRCGIEFSLTYKEVDPTQITEAVKLAKNDLKQLQKYKADWALYEIIKSKLKNFRSNRSKTKRGYLSPQDKARLTTGARADNEAEGSEFGDNDAVGGENAESNVTGGGDLENSRPEDENNAEDYDDDRGAGDFEKGDRPENGDDFESNDDPKGNGMNKRDYEVDSGDESSNLEGRQFNKPTATRAILNEGDGSDEESMDDVPRPEPKQMRRNKLGTRDIPSTARRLNKRAETQVVLSEGEGNDEESMADVPGPEPKRMCQNKSGTTNTPSAAREVLGEKGGEKQNRARGKGKNGSEVEAKTPAQRTLRKRACNSSINDTDQDGRPAKRPRQQDGGYTNGRKRKESQREKENVSQNEGESAGVP